MGLGFRVWDLSSRALRLGFVLEQGFRVQDVIRAASPRKGHLISEKLAHAGRAGDEPVAETVRQPSSQNMTLERRST